MRKESLTISGVNVLVLMLGMLCWFCGRPIVAVPAAWAGGGEL